MFSLIYVWINEWVNNREAGDLRLYRDHYEVIVMKHVLSIMIPLEIIITALIFNDYVQNVQTHTRAY